MQFEIKTLPDGKYYVQYQTTNEAWNLTLPMTSLELISYLSGIGLQVRTLLQKAYLLD